jgi:hypothetical protein
MTAVLLIALFSLFGRRTQPRMDVPTVAPAQTLRIDEQSTEQASIALARGVVGIRRGTTIAHFRRVVGVFDAGGPDGCTVCG